MKLKTKAQGNQQLAGEISHGVGALMAAKKGPGH